MVVVIRRGARSNPERLQREMEEVFQSLVGPRSRPTGHVPQISRPPLEVFETESGLVIHAELAGIEDESLQIMAGTGLVTIRAERKPRPEDGQRKYRETGIRYGELNADVFLPFPVDLDRSEADFSNGMLRIELPRIKARRIVPKSTMYSDEKGS